MHEHFRLPTIDNVLPELSNTMIISKLDFRKFTATLDLTNFTQKILKPKTDEKAICHVTYLQSKVKAEAAVKKSQTCW